MNSGGNEPICPCLSQLDDRAGSPLGAADGPSDPRHYSRRLDPRQQGHGTRENPAATPTPEASGIPTTITERIGPPPTTLPVKHPEITFQPHQHTTKKPYRKALMAGLATGATLGAVEGAMLGRTIGEEGATAGMAFVVAGFGGVTGALTGVTLAALPQRTGWKRHFAGCRRRSRDQRSLVPRFRRLD
jgi:hypothetical protein